MRDAARKVVRYVGARDRIAFVQDQDEVVFDATIQKLSILGEAARGIPDSARARFTEIDRGGVTGLREIVAHAFFAINEAMLWEIANERMPRLLEQLEQLGVARGSSASDEW